jgi:hypothetical protein
MKSANGATQQWGYAAMLAAESEVAELRSATGHYPGPVWAPNDLSDAALAVVDEAEPEPPSPTGRYPGPVWAEDAIAAAVTLGSRIRFGLSGSVGKNGGNAATDVLAVRERLRELGFDWIAADAHGVDNTLIKAIKLFQAIVRGHHSVSGHRDVDGRIDVDGTTYRWLQAVNAPRWELMPEGSAAEGFTNIERADPNDTHDYGTNWMADTIREAGAAYRQAHLTATPGAALLTINDVSLPQGGNTPDHSGHETGLDCDIRLPRTDGSAPGNTTVTHALYDRDAMRAMLVAIRGTRLFARAFLQDPVLIGEGLCQDVAGHRDHAHFEILPPEVGGIELIDVADTDAVAAAAGDEFVGDAFIAAAPRRGPKEPDFTDEIGDAEDPTEGPRTYTVEPLDIPGMYQIIREVAFADSGDSPYTAVSIDDPSATNGGRFGLCFGLVLFPQATGSLGSVLRLMQQRDSSAFVQIFGTDAGELVRVTNAATPAERLRSVGGAPLWSDTWIDRFQQAGEVPAFQAAQNEEAIEHQFRLMMPVAVALGLTTDRCLAMAYDRIVTRGVGGGIRWIVQSVGPLRTVTQRKHAVEMLGFSDLAEFQRSVGWTPANGTFGPETHAALVAALRRQGQIPLPSAEDLACRMARVATGAAKDRLTRLLESSAFRDVTVAAS